MKPIKVNWEIRVPNQAQIDSMWRELGYDVLDKKFEFIELLKSNIGGDVYFKGFRFHEHAIFDWYCSRGRLDEIDFEQKFLLSTGVLRTFKRLTFKMEAADFVEEYAAPIETPPRLIWKNEFTIDGELASLLFHGGSHGSKYGKHSREIKSKAQEFCYQLFQEKYDSKFVRYYTSDRAWNSWFVEEGIDYTFLIICMESRTVWLLAFTDTD